MNRNRKLLKQAIPECDINVINIMVEYTRPCCVKCGVIRHLDGICLSCKLLLGINVGRLNCISCSCGVYFVGDHMDDRKILISGTSSFIMVMCIPCFNLNEGIILLNEQITNRNKCDNSNCRGKGFVKMPDSRFLCGKCSGVGWINGKLALPSRKLISRMNKLDREYE
jgi:hypothetical protein